MYFPSKLNFWAFRNEHLFYVFDKNPVCVKNLCWESLDQALINLIKTTTDLFNPTQYYP